MLNQVAEGVWVRQSEWVMSNAVVVRGEDGLILAPRQVAASAIAEGREVAARLAADHAYIDALRRGEETVDARLEPHWLPIHQSNLERARGEQARGEP